MSYDFFCIVETTSIWSCSKNKVFLLKEKKPNKSKYFWKSRPFLCFAANEAVAWSSTTLHPQSAGAGHPLRLLSKAKIYFGDSPFAIWGITAPTEVGGKQKISTHITFWKGRAQAMSYFGHKKETVYCSHSPQSRDTGIIWPDTHIGNREIVFSTLSHPGRISFKEKKIL